MTCKNVSDTEQGGGSGWWVLNQARASRVDTVVLIHNAHDKRQPGQPSRHRQPFLVGRVSDVIKDHDGRVSVQFSKIADASGASIKWEGQNPLSFVTAGVLEELTIGEWRSLPSVSAEDAQEVRRMWDKDNKV
jgi:hypothetical protein